MLRRPVLKTIPRSLVSPLGLNLAAFRHSSHGPTTHDFSACWSAPLSTEEEVALRSQEHRTVSGVVPGKVFMRHWIAAEQSTVSVVNRVISGFVVVGFMVWACGFATLGYNGHNAVHTASWLFMAYWMVLHTHMMWLLPVCGGLAFGELLLN